MKARITVIDERGKLYEGSVELVLATSGEAQSTMRRSREPIKASTHSFDMNPRAFMKKYAAKCSGPQMFTLLLARLASGRVGSEIELEKIRSSWNRMKTVLKIEFNPAYALRAKENGWVDSPKKGAYVLRPSWREAARTKDGQ